MIESLRTIATAAPGTFHVVRAEFTYASNPGKRFLLLRAEWQRR
jgi:hypothetical protein